MFLQRWMFFEMFIIFILWRYKKKYQWSFGWRKVPYLKLCTFQILRVNKVVEWQHAIRVCIIFMGKKSPDKPVHLQVWSGPSLFVYRIIGYYIIYWQTAEALMLWFIQSFCVLQKNLFLMLFTKYGCMCQIVLKMKNKILSSYLMWSLWNIG